MEKRNHFFQGVRGQKWDPTSSNGKRWRISPKRKLPGNRTLAGLGLVGPLLNCPGYTMVESFPCCGKEASLAARAPGSKSGTQNPQMVSPEGFCPDEICQELVLWQTLDSRRPPPNCPQGTWVESFPCCGKDPSFAPRHPGMKYGSCVIKWQTLEDSFQTKATRI